MDGLCTISSQCHTAKLCETGYGHDAVSNLLGTLKGTMRKSWTHRPVSMGTLPALGTRKTRHSFKASSVECTGASEHNYDQTRSLANQSFEQAPKINQGTEFEAIRF